MQALGVKLLLRRTLGMLSSKDESARQAALRSLLPSCLQAAALVGGQLQQLALSAVWQRCRWSPDSSCSAHRARIQRTHKYASCVHLVRGLGSASL